MTRRLVMPTLIVSIALWGCQPAPETATPAPQGPVELLETPFTAEQIREEWIQGLTILMETSSRGAGTLERWTVLAADEAGAEIEFAPVDVQGNPVGDSRQLRLTWEGLRDHGAFPAALANREEAVRDTPLGELNGWLYTVQDGGGGESEYFFAKSLPGAPVHLKVTKDDALVMELAQIERKRPQEAGQEPGNESPGTPSDSP